MALIELGMDTPCYTIQTGHHKAMTLPSGFHRKLVVVQPCFMSIQMQNLGSPSQLRDKVPILVEHPEPDQFPKDTVVGIPITADTGDSLYVARGKWKDDEMLGRK